MLEAERAKDEMRDIMSRMIGAEIRYSRMGYWVRKAPMGFVNEKVETPNGKRTVLKPHPIESAWIFKMFELRCRGTMSDHQIVEEVNNLGFKSRMMYFRDHHDRTKLIKQTGGKPLTLKGLWIYLKNPLYAGINLVNWTKDNPQKGKFEGIVTIEMFNNANRGKIAIVEENGEISIERNVQARYQIKKGVRNPDFPYKRVVMCPCCSKPMFGSASKGRLGKYYPAYHCNKRGHYYRVPKKDFDDTIKKFIKNVNIAPNYGSELEKAVIAEWEKRNAMSKKDEVNIDTQITALQEQQKLTAGKIRYLTSEIAIKYVEEDLLKIQNQITGLMKEKEKTIQEDPNDIKKVMKYIKYFLEHWDYLLMHSPDPVAKASYFGVLFDALPNYEELVSGTQKKAEFIKLNEAFVLNSGCLAGELDRRWNHIWENLENIFEELQDMNVRI